MITTSEVKCNDMRATDYGKDARIIIGEPMKKIGYEILPSRAIGPKVKKLSLEASEIGVFLLKIFSHIPSRMI